MSKKLNPCSICGSPAERVWDPEEELVKCSNEASSCHNAIYPMYIKEWQRRTIEDALTARIAEFEAENEKLKAAQEWISVEDELPKEDYVESDTTYDLVVQYVDQPAFVTVAIYYNKLWYEPNAGDWELIPNEFAKFWRERPLPPLDKNSNEKESEK